MARQGPTTFSFGFNDGELYGFVAYGDRQAIDRYAAVLEREGRDRIEIYDRAVPANVLADLVDQLGSAPTSGRVELDPGKHARIVDALGETGALRDRWVIGDRGRDVLRGSNGDDVIVGGAGSDVVRAQSGDDHVEGGAGDDRIAGVAGADILWGGDGNDTVDGGSGDDIVSGGAGSDRLSGGSGADTFMFEGADLKGRTIDIITGFDDRGGDQIVDLSRDLRVVDVGRIEAVRGNGTLLESRRTDALVFVQGAELSQGDIARRYTAPESPAERAGVFEGPKETLYSVDVRRVSSWDNGRPVELYEAVLTNEGARTIGNVDDLRLSLPRAPGMEILGVGGGTLDGGRIASTAGFTLGPSAEGWLFNFEVADRPAGVRIDDDTVGISFAPRDDAGRPISDRNAFALSVDLVESHAGGASVEVSIRNIGASPLSDLDDLVFRFEDEVAGVSSTWGASHRGGVFSVSPWNADTPHADLQPGQKIKLFGFAFDALAGETPTRIVDVSDFDLLSRFDDLLS